LALIYNVKKCHKAVARKIDRNGLVFANSYWEMLLKASGQPWALLKGYRKASVKCPTVIR
jgi:hypothetical protein